jgi:hypothetical protein
MERESLPDWRRLPWGRYAWYAGIGVAVLVVLAAVAQLLGMLPQWQNPFEQRETDRSQPVLLEKIQDLSRYEAATGNFQVVIDLQRDAAFIPDSILGERTLFVAAGSVDAYVDFSAVGKGAIKLSEKSHRATVRLPHAQLEKVNLNHKRSYVYAEERGVLNRIGEFFDRDPNKQRKLYVLAEKKIQTAAERSRLARQAETNTRAMLVGMLGSLGYTKVTVKFGGPEG